MASTPTNQLSQGQRAVLYTVTTIATFLGFESVVFIGEQWEAGPEITAFLAIAFSGIVATFSSSAVANRMAGSDSRTEQKEVLRTTMLVSAAVVFLFPLVLGVFGAPAVLASALAIGTAATRTALNSRLFTSSFQEDWSRALSWLGISIVAVIAILFVSRLMIGA